jgi:hypothetical protein
LLRALGVLAHTAILKSNQLNVIKLIQEQLHSAIASAI